MGVVLLLRWAAEHDLFPLEARMLSAAVVGLALVVVGYRKRVDRRGFAQTLHLLRGFGVVSIGY